MTTALLTVGSAMIPVLGSGLSTVLTGALSFGLMCVSSEIKKNGTVNFKILFAGFDNGVIQRLYTLIFLWFVLGMIQGVVSFFFRALPYGAAISTVVSILISVGIISFIIFAPALIIWYDKPTKVAIDLNFEAARKNVGALAVYSLVPAVFSFAPVIFLLTAVKTLPQVAAAIFSVVTLVGMLVAVVVFSPAIVASLYFLFEAIFLGQPVEAGLPEELPPQSVPPQ